VTQQLCSVRQLHPGPQGKKGGRDLTAGALPAPNNQLLGRWGSGKKKSHNNNNKKNTFQEEKKKSEKQLM